MPTITVDKSQGCTLEFAARGQFIWADCRNLKLRVNDQVIIIITLFIIKNNNQY